MVAYTDLPPALLREHRTQSTEPDDFDEQWAATVAGARAAEGGVTMHPVKTGLSLVDTWDVRFPGFGGQPIGAWLRAPRGSTGPLPCVVEFVGYGGGRGLAHERLLWSTAGYAHFLMDTRGQGAAWSHGVTDDPDGSGPAVAGVMTRGIEEFSTYYYRRLMADAMRAVDAAKGLDLVDASRVVVAGTSQGGGLAIAAAALGDGVAGAMVDVPFLCDLPRALQLAVRPPYDEVVRYLATHRDRSASVLRTLSYIDAAHHAARARLPALFSVGLMDQTCPPSTVYAAYNAWAGDKRIVEYPFNEHEGGGGHHESIQLDWLDQLLS